jgi:hypothetical protein
MITKSCWTLDDEETCFNSLYREFGPLKLKGCSIMMRGTASKLKALAQNRGASDPKPLQL